MMAMLQGDMQPEAMRRCLDTLSFLLLDRANRLLVAEMHGLNVLRSIVQHTNDAGVLRLALDCLATLLKCDDKEKVGTRARKAWRCSLLCQDPDHTALDVKKRLPLLEMPGRSVCGRTRRHVSASLAH
jgi:hypothetical protein